MKGNKYFAVAGNVFIIHITIKKSTIKIIKSAISTFKANL